MKLFLEEGRTEVDVTMGELKMLLSGQSVESHSLKVGEAVFIRTVTHHYTGRIVAVTDSDILLEDAAWIADDGRFFTALSTGVLNEVEPFPFGCAVGRGAIVDVSPWRHSLPKEQK